MIVKLDIPDYEEDGVDVFWEKNASYRLYAFDNSIHLVANSEGLMSFAKQMLYLAQKKVPDGSHVHFDSFFTGIMDTSTELVIAKKTQP